MKHSLAISLITLGDPAQLTGGYLYHRRLAQLASRHAASLAFVSLPDRPFPLPSLAGHMAIQHALAERPEVVLVDSIAAAFVAPAMLRRRLPVPLCAVLHQPPGGIGHGPVRSRVQAKMDMLLYRRAALLIMASQILACEMQKWRISLQRLCVVPPGCEVFEDLPPGAPPVNLRDGAQAAFLCVANWLPHKGIHTLLDAFALLPPGAGALHLVGDNRVQPAYAKRIAGRIAQPDLVWRVFVHGTLPPPAVAAHYRMADVFVLPSYKETYGTVYGEAMSSGLPVVGLRAGNLPNLVDSGIEGLLVEPADVTGLARALGTLASDERRRRQMGDAARKRALQYPTWDESAGAFFTALRTVASAGHC